VTTAVGTAARLPVAGWLGAKQAKRLAPVVGIVVLLALWQLIAVTVAAGRHIVPTVPEVVNALVADGFYLVHVQTTLWEAAQGFFWGNLAAFAVAGVCLVLPPLRTVLTRVAMTTYSTPTIAIAPLLIVLFDPQQTKVVMAGLSVFFPTLLGTLLGFEGAPKGAMEFAHVCGAPRWFALLRVQLRAAVVPIAGALSLAAPAAMVGAMIGEYLGGDAGLGAQLVQAQQALEVERAWAVAIEATVLSTLVYLGIGLLARWLTYTDTTTELTGAAPSGPAGRRGWRGRLPGLLRGLVTLAVVVALWYALVEGLGNSYLAKTPDQVVRYLFAGTGDGPQIGAILGELGETLFDAAIGYVAGTVAAIVAAALFLSSSLLEGMFLPIVMTLRAVPLVAMTPLIALIFGRGVLTVAVLAGAVTFVPTLVIVLAALRAVPKPAIDLTHVYAVGRVRAFGIRMVYAVPALAASARVALPGSILGAVLVEILATGSRIGNVVAISIGSSEYLTLWSALAVLTTVTAVLYALLSMLESTALARLTR
jgi:sulfonate transport system permease protein